jgi:hypothetical protein
MSNGARTHGVMFAALSASVAGVAASAASAFGHQCSALDLVAALSPVFQGVEMIFLWKSARQDGKSADPGASAPS